MKKTISLRGTDCVITNWSLQKLNFSSIATVATILLFSVINEIAPDCFTEIREMQKYVIELPECILPLKKRLPCFLPRALENTFRILLCVGLSSCCDSDACAFLFSVILCSHTQNEDMLNNSKREVKGGMRRKMMF